MEKLEIQVEIKIGLEIKRESSGDGNWNVQLEKVEMEKIGNK